MVISKRHTQTKLSKFKFLPLPGKVGLPNITFCSLLQTGHCRFPDNFRTFNGPMWQLSKRCYLTMRLPVFRRYFLSDAANQADLVMVWECENSYCPLSIGGASSTKREQNSHVDLVSDRYHCRNDQKRNVESQTQPLYTILDRGLLQ